jgi:hypothetical protein
MTKISFFIIFINYSELIKLLNCLYQSHFPFFFIMLFGLRKKVRRW